MAVYATVSDLEVRWRPLTPEERPVAETLLGDASVRLRSEVTDLPARILTDLTGDLKAVATVVVCAMVRRAMVASDTGIGVTTAQETQGPFSRSFNYSNPMGDLYVTRAEKRFLGGGRQQAFTIDTAPDTVPDPWAWLA